MTEHIAALPERGLGATHETTQKRRANARVLAAGQMLKNLAVNLSGFALLLILWQLVTLTFGKDIPGPLETLRELWILVSHPFYDDGPNDKGIGLLTLFSLGRVAAGWLCGSLLAIPLGLLLGASTLGRRIFAPVVEVLRPVSPLAWFPIGMAILKSAPNAAIFAVFITCLWPTLLNTIFGVSSLPDDYKNVARVFQFSRAKYVQKILLPYALPHIITGLRLSMGIAWMVIVAAEMLSAVPGIGGFVWDSWNSLMLTRVISAILIIGFIGLALDRGFDRLHKKFAYGA